MIKKLFLAHHSKYAAEVHELATELRLRGVVPWVDKKGGFEVGDDSEAAARRAIREDCFGLLLYATESAFERDFIARVEIDQALKALKDSLGQEDQFDLMAVPRGMSFERLRDLSERSFGFDLSARHTMPFPESPILGTVDPAQGSANSVELEADFRKRASALASEIARRVVRRAIKARGLETISIQFATRSEAMPFREADVLFIDARELFADGVVGCAKWSRVHNGLVDVRTHLAANRGRGRIYVHGSKHTTGAFLFGRIFSRFTLDIRQSGDESAVWSTDATPSSDARFSVLLEPSAPPSNTDDELEALAPPRRPLFVEVAVGLKNIREGTEAHSTAHRVFPVARLQLGPEDTEAGISVGERICRALSQQAYACIQKAVRDYACTEIHLFVAAHQAFTMMLGHTFFNGMPPVHLYEWVDNRYVKSYVVPSDT